MTPEPPPCPSCGARHGIRYTPNSYIDRYGRLVGGCLRAPSMSLAPPDPAPKPRKRTARR